MKAPDEKYSEEIQRLLREVVSHFDTEDRAVRERQIRLWKKLKYYWDGYQRLWWSEVAHDWRVYDADTLGTSSQDQSFYDKPINIFKAYLESIIAALSINIPGVKCYPDDAENPSDLSTSRAGDRIAELVAKHNNASMLWLHALYIFCTEGMVAGYSYTKEDEAYGTYEEKEYKDEEIEARICPNCQQQIADEEFTSRERDEFMPGNDDVAIQDAIQNGPICQQCGIMLDPELQKSKLIVTRLVGINRHPKSRQCIEVHGGLFIKVANYAQNQSETPYLIYAYETHYANVLERYPHLMGKLKNDTKSGTTSQEMYDAYEQWGRLSTQYFGDYPSNTITVRNSWLRPAAFNILHDEDDIKLLKKHFPNGTKVVLVNDLFADAENENLDDCWTLSYNPLSDYIHHQPLGAGLTPIQEITNDLVSLTLQTIEHGIPQTFADPSVLNFEEYRQTEATPGGIYPAKAASGRSIGDGFYEVKTANLSPEVLPFSDRIQEAGQLTSGALPSLFGGAAPNSSKTASQYAMSRAQAQQRLQINWKILCIWWKTIFGKVIPAYIKEVVEDEHFVEKDAQGNFLNVFIRRAELDGKIGSIELEVSEELPVTWAQKKDNIMELMQLSNPMIQQAIIEPENIPFLRDVLGIPEFKIPGERDREKQYEEIRALVNSAPIDDGMQELPSVEIEPMLDNNEIHADICKDWLIGASGRLAKIENPEGYKNVLLHFQQHVQYIQMTAQVNAAQEQPSQGRDQKKQEAAPMGKPDAIPSV